jgi:hypothetical protein
MPAISSQLIVFLMLLPAPVAAVLIWLFNSAFHTWDARRPGMLARLGVTAGLLALAAWLGSVGSLPLEVLAAFIAWLFAVDAFASLLHRVSDSRTAGRRFWLPVVAVLGFALWVANHGYDQQLRVEAEERRRQEALAALEKKAADELKAARRTWNPGSGVVELQAGKLLAWLAVTPEVSVDWAYEQELAAGATRRIPVQLVMLNNSFEDLAPKGGSAAWRIEVRRGGQAIAAWRQDADLFERVFAPAEKRQIDIQWDGRSTSGALAAPGDYLVAASLEGIPGTLEMKLQIVDKGPEEIVERDPISVTLERQAQNVIDIQRNMEFSRQLEQYNIRPFGFGR